MNAVVIIAGLVITLLVFKQMFQKEADDKQLENDRKHQNSSEQDTKLSIDSDTSGQATGKALELKPLQIRSFKWVDNPLAKEEAAAAQRS